jgi:hypothetical protein
MEFAEGFDADREARVATEFSEEIRRAITKVFQELPLSEADVRHLIQLAAAALCRDYFPETTAGVVVAGFGAEEHFPVLLSASVQARIMDRLKHRAEHNVTISADERAVIVPFAQRDVVELFIEGVDPQFRGLVLGAMREAFRNYPTEIVKDLTQLTDPDRTALVDTWTAVGVAAVTRFSDLLDKVTQGSFVAPLLRAVAILPKNELAVLAEALVNLTSLKRRVSMDAETVGGAIDVAVISKGDGLVWIQRKHYFEAELNHHFFSNYHLGANATEDADA